MQAYEGVGVVPVPAGPMAAVDDDHRGIRVGEQRIDERHADRTRSDDDVIRFEIV